MPDVMVDESRILIPNLLKDLSRGQVWCDKVRLYYRLEFRQTKGCNVNWARISTWRGDDCKYPISFLSSDDVSRFPRLLI